MKFINNTKASSRIGYVVKSDPRDPQSFIYADASDTKVLGIVTESVPFRAECEIQTTGTATVFVSGGVTRGSIVRNQKSTDQISKGQTKMAKDGDAPYLQIGYATESGKGLVKCSLRFNYQYSDSDTITWDDITGKPTTFPPSSHTHLFSEIGTPSSRVVTDTTTELTTDNMIVCNKATSMTVNLLPATGSNRIRQIASINNVVTVDGDGSDTISGQTTQVLNGGDCMVIKDYASGKWLIL